MRKQLFFYLLLIILLSACQTADKKEAIKPADYAKEIGAKYGDSNPRIVKTTTTLSDDAKEPMYRILLQGKFNLNNQTTPYLSFSATKYYHHVWAITPLNNLP